MELAINHSKVKSGNGEAKYFVRTGQVISSNLESTTHTYSDTTVTGRSYITSRTKKKTVFWLRFDNGQERKYVLNSDVDILTGQKISLLYLEGKKSTWLVSRTIRQVNTFHILVEHSSVKYLNQTEKI